MASSTVVFPEPDGPKIAVTRVSKETSMFSSKPPAVCGSAAACHAFLSERSSHSDDQTNRKARTTVIPSKVKASESLPN